jgi:predicted acylesterase/phospholipase RssA
MPQSAQGDYTAADFVLKPGDDGAIPECDLVMKGGITSGVVYPFAILELARKYRFRGVGGTSAGAIAAAFVAAAEYARQNGDPSGFLRLKARSEQLPKIMLSLFQPTPRLGGLMRYLLRAQPRGAFGFVLFAPICFWLTSLIGLAVGGGLMWLAAFLLNGLTLPLPRAAWAGVGMGALIGLIVALLIRIVTQVFSTRTNGFGICPGLTQKGGKTPALTDWIYQSLQEIAFGPNGRDKPLTFGDLKSIAVPPGETNIELRAVTTDLSMGHPRSLPNLGDGLRFKTEDWARLFPAPVMNHMLGLDSQPDTAGDDWSRMPRVPGPDDLPVIVAVRMSLSFPVLFTAIPLYFRDISLLMLKGDQTDETYDPIKFIGDPHPEIRKLWFTDGGVTANFPIQFFDAMLPGRPTFALSLDQLIDGMNPDQGGRVYLPHKAEGGSFLTLRPIPDLKSFGGAVFNAAQNWQDTLMSVMGAQRERVARVYLTSDQGGLNLSMPPEVSEALMGYGRVAGIKFSTEFDFEEHRWRRSLVAYEKLQEELGRVRFNWIQRGFGAFLKGYLPEVQSYQPTRDRYGQQIWDRLDNLAAAAKQLENPPIPTRKDFPRPPGSLRITPKI